MEAVRQDRVSRQASPGRASRQGSGHGRQRRSHAAARLASSRLASLPAEKEWRDCCVPLKLLLDEYSLVVQRENLRRGVCVYLTVFVFLVTFGFARFSGKASALLLYATQIGLSVTPMVLITEPRVRMNFVGDVVEADGATSTPGCSFQTPQAEANLTSPIGTQVAPYALYDWDSYVGYFSDAFAFNLCQPGDVSGICAATGAQAQRRGDVYEGSRARADETCLAEQDLASLAFPEVNLLCSAVSLAGGSDLFCFGGFDQGTASGRLNAAWDAGVGPASAAGLELADAVVEGADLGLCSSFAYGVLPGCFLAAEQWDSMALDTSVSAAGFERRIQGLAFTSQRSELNEAALATGAAYSFAWVDANSRALRSSVLKSSVATGSLSSLRIELQQSIGGGVRVSQRALAVGGLALPAPGETSASAVVVLALLLLLIAYMVWDLFSPLLRAFIRDDDTKTGVAYYLNNRSWWHLLDFALLVLYVSLAVVLVANGFVVGDEDSDFGDPDAFGRCKGEDFLVRINVTKQTVGVTLFLVVLRLFRYISLAPRLHLTWRAVTRGVYYYVPSFLILFALANVFALANLIELHEERGHFGNYYNALLAMVLFYGDGGSAAWASLMQPGTAAASSGGAGAGASAIALLSASASASAGANVNPLVHPQARFFGLLWVFEFFVVIPFTALAISAFYYALVFTESVHHQQKQQASADNRAAQAQAVLSRVLGPPKPSTATAATAATAATSATVATVATVAVTPASVRASVRANARAMAKASGSGDVRLAVSLGVGASPRPMRSRTTPAASEDGDVGSADVVMLETRLENIVSTGAAPHQQLQAPSHRDGLPTNAVNNNGNISNNNSSGHSGGGAWGVLQAGARRLWERLQYASFRVRLFFCGGRRLSEAEAARLHRLRRRTVKPRDALFRLRVHAARPENAFAVFVSYDDIAQVVGTLSRDVKILVPHDTVIGIMRLVGNGNVYDNSVKRRFNTELLARRSRGQRAQLPNSTEIAESEGRRRKVKLAPWAEEESEAASIQRVTDGAQKLHDTTKVAVDILMHDVLDLEAKQQAVIRDLTAALQQLRGDTDPGPGPVPLPRSQRA